MVPQRGRPGHILQCLGLLVTFAGGCPARLAGDADFRGEGCFPLDFLGDLVMEEKEKRQGSKYLCKRFIRLPVRSLSSMNSRRKHVSVSPPPSLRRPLNEEDGWTLLRSRVEVVSPTKPAARRGRKRRTDSTRRSRIGPALLDRSDPTTSLGASLAAPAQMPHTVEASAVQVEEDIPSLDTNQVMEDPWKEQSDGERDTGIVEDVDCTPEKTVVNSFEQYVDAVLMLMVGFIHLSHNLFAVQGWSKDRGEGQVQCLNPYNFEYHH